MLNQDYKLSLLEPEDLEEEGGEEEVKPPLDPLVGEEGEEEEKPEEEQGM